MVEKRIGQRLLRTQAARNNQTAGGAHRNRQRNSHIPNISLKIPTTAFRFPKPACCYSKPSGTAVQSCFRDLSRDVFPLFSGLLDAKCVFRGMNGPAGVSPYEHLEISEYDDTPRSTERRKKLKMVLQAWAQRFQVTEKWAKDEAMRTMGHWYRLPIARQSLEWNPFYTHSSIVSAIGDPFEFRFQGWQTQLHSWPYYRQAIRREFETTLDKYEEQTRHRAESFGLVRSQRTFSRASFKWFALYQFYGLSPGTSLIDALKTIQKRLILPQSSRASRLPDYFLAGTTCDQSPTGKLVNFQLS